MQNRNSAVIDINNLIWTLSRPSAGVPRRLAVLLPLIAELRRIGIGAVFGVADAKKFYLVDDAPARAEIEPALDEFHIAPAGEPADRMILTLARERDAWIVSNDHFREWKKRDRWVKRNAWRRRVTVSPAGDLQPDRFSLTFPL